jgi:hypothetical protein
MQIGESYISRRTFVLLVGGLFLLAVVSVVALTIAQTVTGDKNALTLIADLGSVVFGSLAAAVLFTSARCFDADNPLRRIWLLIGAGMAAYAVGDLVWAVLDIRSGFGAVPYPSVADLFYIAMYVFVALGLVRTARAFGRAARVTRALVIGAVLTVLAAALFYVLIAAQVVGDPTTSLLQKVLGAAYPIADILFLLAPAFFILLAAPHFRGARQWWVLAFGLIAMSLSDIGFTWFQWTGRLSSAVPVEFGWMLSLLLIAVAGSLAADVARGQGRPAAGPRTVGE